MANSEQPTNVKDTFLDNVLGPEVLRSGECEKHGPWSRMVREKHAWTAACLRCAEEAKAARERKEAEEKAAATARRRQEGLSEAGVSIRHMGKTFDAFVAETAEQSNALAKCKDLADGVLADPHGKPSLILSGKPGTGKTHLACAMAIAVYDGGKQVARISAGDMVREFKDSWRKESEFDERKLLSWYGGVSLLIIEEVGVQFGSDTERMYLFEVINRRYENMLPTVIVSNLDADRLSAELGERTIDRLREDGGRLLKFSGESWRKQ